jgi:hypothetical protein
MFSLFKKKNQSKQTAQQPKNTAPPKDNNIPVSD